MRGGNLITEKTKDIFYFLTNKYRNHLSKSAQKIVGDNQQKKIVDITIIRTPLNKNIITVGNLLTHNDLDKARQELKYDNLYHLYSIITFDDGTKILYEKNQVPNISYNLPKKTTGTKELKVDGVETKKLTILEYIKRGVKKMGNVRYLTYKLNGKGKSTCQSFQLEHLNANGLSTPELEKFIEQDSDTLLRNLPGIPNKIKDVILDFAGRADILINGRGKKKINKRL